MTRILLCMSTIVLVASAQSASAAVITTFDFTDGNWTTTLTASGGTNDSTVTATTITADKSGAAGGVRVTVDLTGAISTLGFENITLAFFGDSSTGMEWNADLTVPVAGSDGLRIFGSGVEINTSMVDGTTAEGEFEAGTMFPTANFSSDFAFDASVNNNSLTDLQFILQVNAGDETLSVSSVQLLGDAIAIPEPSSLTLLGLTAMGFGALRSCRRRLA